MQLASFNIKDPTSSVFGSEVFNKLLDLPGVSDVLIGKHADTCNVVYDQGTVNASTILDALVEAGYDCEIDVREPVFHTSCCGGCS